MATAGSIVVSLLASTGSFETDIDRSTRNAERRFKQMERTVDQWARRLTAGAGAAAAAFTAWAMGMSRSMDATLKMAEQIGTTTEALTGLRYAAQQMANVSDGTFDMALRRMTRRIAEAAEGGGAAAKALEELGLNARQLSNLSVDEQFLRLADAMQKTERQGSRLRHTMAIFDTEGMPLVNALSQGRAEIQKFVEEAERFGLVVSTDAARAAADFQSEIGRLQAMVSGLSVGLANEVLPTLNEFVSRATDAATETGGLHDEVRNLTGDSALKEWFDAGLVGFARIADVAVFLAKAVGVVGGAFRSVAADAEVAVAAMNKAQIWNWGSEEASQQLQDALTRRNAIVGKFNTDLSDLATYEGNRFEQAALASINTIKVQSDAVKLIDLTLEEASKSADKNTKATKANAAALTEAQRAAQNFRREQDQSLRSQLQFVSAIHDQAQALEDQIAVYGLGKTAIEDLNIARLEEQATILRGFEGSQEAVEAIEREIEARRRLRTAIGSMEQKEAERQAWEEWARDVEQIFDRVGQSLTDAIFEGGRNAKDLLKDIFKSLTFNVLINPVMQGMQGWVTNTLGGALGGQGGGGIAGLVQNASTLYSAVTGGLTSSLAAGAASIGSAIGSSALTSFAAGMKGSTLAAGLAGPTTAGATGAMGLGSMAATALPWIGGGLAIAGLLGGGLFDREPTTRREQRTQIEFANGLFGTTRTDDRMPGADAAARQLAEQAVSTANDIFKQVGVDAAIDSFHAIMASSYKGDRDGVASGGTLRIGDQLRQFGIANEGNPTIQGFGGWSDADTLPRLATDIQLSILEAFQSAGVLSSILEGIDIRGLGEQAAQELAASVQQIVGETSAFQEAIESLPFANLRDLSFDAAANLIQFAGGLDQLNAGMATYFREFYSQEEQLAQATQNMSRAFGELGLELPDVASGADQAKAEFRAIVDSLDVTTEEGQRTYAALMGLAGGFSQLVSGMDELSAASVRAAEEQTRAAQQVREQALSNLTSAYNAVVEAGQREIAKLQESFSATDSAMNTYRSKVQEYINSFNGLFSAIDQGVKALRGTGAAFQADYNRARAVISTTLLIGQLPQTADLSDALRVAQQGVTGQVYASRFEQEKAYATLANEMEAIKEIAEPELDAAQATLNQLEDQYRLLRGMSRVGEDSLESLEAQLRTALSTEEVARSQITLVESQLEEARRQYDALTGIDSSIKDLATAMREFAAAATAARTVVGGGGGGGSSNLGLDPVTHPHPVGAGSDYQRAVEYYRNNPDVANAFNNVPGATFVEFAKEHYEKYGRAEGRKSFAVGTNYVPYDMTAQIHKGERIIPAADNRELIRKLSGPSDSRELIAEVRQLRAEVAGLRGEQKTSQFAIAKYTQKTAKKLDEFGEIGMPVTEGIPA